MATQFVTCPTCSSQNSSMNARCTNCGTVLPPISPMPMQHVPQSTGAPLPGAEKKIAAGICGIVLNGLRIHKFILGYTQEGVIMLSAYLVTIILAVVTCGIATPLVMVPAVIGIIEGIIYLTKSDEEFVQTYIVNKKPWF